MPTVIGQSADPSEPGVLGTPLNTGNAPIFYPAVGVKGDGGAGGPFVAGTPGRTGIGVYGTSADPNGAGVWGENTAGGMAGQFDGNVWVTGGNLKVNTNVGQAITATSTDPSNDAINATTSSAEHAAVSANNTSQFTGKVPSGFALWASSNATGIFAQGNPAGYFNGDVQVTGDLILINSPASGDVAEDFDLEDDPQHAEPGTVLIINLNGKLCASLEAYDTRVAGVVSGAGELRPALVLQRIRAMGRRSPIALIGKAFCKVDADFGSVVAGDLLTTSATQGHAMKVIDRSKALGAILGKALGSLKSGRGLVPILVSLR
jgi:hypothetical protein